MPINDRPSCLKTRTSLDSLILDEEQITDLDYFDLKIPVDVNSSLESEWLDSSNALDDDHKLGILTKEVENSLSFNYVEFESNKFHSQSQRHMDPTSLNLISEDTSNDTLSPLPTITERVSSKSKRADKLGHKHSMSTFIQDIPRVLRARHSTYEISRDSRGANNFFRFGRKKNDDVDRNRRDSINGAVENLIDIEMHNDIKDDSFNYKKKGFWSRLKEKL